MIRSTMLLIALLSVGDTLPAHAIDADLAKQCRAMSIKAHPPQPPGTTSDFGKLERDYYKQCVAQKGIMDVIEPSNPPASPTSPPKSEKSQEQLPL
jgi:hypothetical protein